MLELIPFTLIVFYIVPWVVAISRGLDHHGWIFALNVLLGWTVIGWLVALALALKLENGEAARRGGAPVIPLPPRRA